MLTFSSIPSNVPSHPVRILAVGHGGLNLLDRILLDHGGHLDAVAIDSEGSILNASAAPEKLLLGHHCTRGLGSAGDPDLGRQALMENAEELLAFLENTSGLILLGGLGGGTGSTVLPWIAEQAHARKIPVFCAVTLPFHFEGPRRQRQAEEALKALQVRAGGVAAFPLEKLGEFTSPSAPVAEAFAAADELLAKAVGAFLEMLRGRGPLDTHLGEVLHLLRPANHAGPLFFSHATVRGATRAHDALARALKSPLAQAGLPAEEVRRLHAHISSDPTLTLAELRTLMDLVRRHFEDDIHLHCGITLDHPTSGELSLTLLGSAPLPISAPISTPVSCSAPASPPTALSSSALPSPTSSSSPDLRPDASASHFVANQIPAQEAPPSSAPAAQLQTEALPNTSPSSPNAPASAVSAPLDSTPPIFPDAPLPLEPPLPPDSPLTSGAEVAPSTEELFPHIIPTAPRTPLRPPKKSPPKTQQEVLPLDVAARGRFERSEPTIEEGEDLDVPTFIRLKIPLK